MELELNHYMAIALFASFILLLFIGYPVAWLMGGLAIIFTAISVFSDTPTWTPLWESTGVIARFW